MQALTTKTLAETPEERAKRLRYEAVCVAEARAEIAAGNGVSGPELDNWLRSFVAGEPLDVPGTTHPD
ncbi:MAG: hypothetical protein ABI056_00720 [Caulobacteraceae bacterium]